MCGICGFNWRDPELAKRMTEVIAHRGPDQDGVWCDEHVSLGHRRLSIIDLTETGRQPMSNEDGSVQPGWYPDPLIPHWHPVTLEPLAGAFVDLWRGRPIEERTTIPTRHPGPDGDPLMVFPPAAFDRIYASKNLGGAAPWRVGSPQAIQKGADVENNLTPPGVDGHVSDHYLAYVDLERAAP